MGPAGAGSLATVINAALANKARFERMDAFFDGVGEGHAAGIWEEVPTDRPKFKAKFAGKLAAAKKAAEAVGS